jgi:trypsin
MRRVITLTIATVLIYSSLLPSNASEIDEGNTAVDSEVQLLDPSVEPQLSSEELTSEPLDVTNDQNQQDPSTNSGKIVGGTVTQITSVPWQVALLTNYGATDFQAQFCGGSIISERWILTAAHCLENRGNVLQPNAIKILSGQTKLNQFIVSPGLSVSRIILHPEYDFRTYRNDIALIELSSPIPFNANQKPIGLPEGPMPSAGTIAKVSGWGSIRYLSNVYPTNLLSAEVSLVRNQECLQRYGNFIAQVMFCAAHPNFHQDTCQGDSGGPLAVFDSQLGWRILGVTSFGNGCADRPFPGVYSRVLSFKDWIQGYLPPPPSPVIASASLFGREFSNSRLAIRSSISGKPTSVSYSWFRCQVPAASTSDIAGTCIDTGNQRDSMLVDGADVGSYLVGRITATNSNGTTQAFTNYTGLIHPGISGVPVPGKRLTFVVAGSVPWNSSFSYQWIRNGTPITGQTGQSYSVAKSDRGKSVTLRVQVSREGFVESLNSSPLAVGKSLPKPKSSLNGEPVFDKVLKSEFSFGSLKPKLSYQWMRNGSPINRATKSSYRLTTSDIGKKVHVVVTARLKGYGTQEFKGKASKTVRSATFTKSTPTVTGNFGIGKTLKASIASLGAKNAKKEYQWLRSGKAIPGATKSKYKLTINDAGKKISVRVKAVKAGYKTMSVTSPSLDSWVKTTLTETWYAPSLPCVEVVNTFEPCSPSGLAMYLYSDSRGSMVVASSIPTTGAVQKWRLTFGEVTTYGDTFTMNPTSRDPYGVSNWSSPTPIRTSGYDDIDVTTNWTNNVGSSDEVHFIIRSSARFAFMRYETVTIEYETIQ